MMNLRSSCLFVLAGVVSTSAATSAAPQDENEVAARGRMLHARRERLLSQGIQINPYIIQVNESDIQHVLQRVLPQYDLMNVDTLPESFPQDAFYEFSRAFEGRAFNGALCHLSPATLQLLRSLPHVVSIDQDFLVTPSAVVTQQNAPWHLDRIDSHPRTYDSRFSYQSNGRGIDIYIIDTGIKTKHTEFTGRIMPGRNFDPGFASTDVEDCYGHGTHVAGLAAGTTYGAAKGANIIPVRIFGCSGGAPTSLVVDAMNYVFDRMLTSTRRVVVNLSVGTLLSTAVNDAATRLVNAGAVVVAAAGNSAVDACTQSPASATGIITVGASDINDNFASFSNFGSCVSLFAPGSRVTSSYIGKKKGATKVLSGTSMSSPVVAGVAAAYLQQVPTATVSAVKNALLAAGTHGAVRGVRGSTTPNILLYSSLAAPARLRGKGRASE